MPTYSGPLQSVFESSALWLIPLLPLLGAILNAVIGWRIQRANIGNQLAKKLHIGSLPVSAIAVGAMAISFALSIWQVIKLAGLPEHQRTLLCHMWPMVRVGSFDLSFDLSLDPLSAVMLLVVTGIGLLIHIYACGYMEKEPSYWRFFSYLNLFIFSMLLLVLGDNFIIMFFGWEGVGLCSYLLIGFWYQDYGKASAGTKAFLTNRIGDFGFLSGLFILLWALGGNWTSQGYQTDINPRLVPVVLDHASAHDATPVEAAPKPTDHHAHATAYLTFTSFPGAKVYIDGNLSEPLIAPFVRHEIGGPTSYRRTQAVPFGIADDPRAQRAAKAADEPTIPVKILVVPGGATDALDLNKDNNRLDLPVGKETILSPIGTVLSFRDLSNQMLIQDQETGARPFHVGLKSKSLWGIAAITLACIGFFIGAAGKSAQIPLYVWLPDAMAGPTPVSALIHAATMVTAGVYMVARLNFLFSMSATACGVVAVVGACTALYAASIGFFQYDIKKVLAYSTVSQLGFMFIGIGVGAYYAGIFHVVTHAFFKACLFLTAGSVIHGMHAVEHDADRAQDMRVMGGLKRKMPHTRLAYLIACLAITAAPIPLLAGFWSKDEILWRAFSNSNTGIVPGAAIWLVGLLAAACT
ncbi:MAG: NADH-quinone oxidoreductase subunit L, partial [Polyangiaceae bacterium]|nr:NADH-quinone oxidoreductase subunit L [Polyangiaceae bacterium]